MSCLQARYEVLDPYNNGIAVRIFLWVIVAHHQNLHYTTSTNACWVLVRKHEGKSPLGRPRHRWEHNIKTNLGDK
jgi:hypothetical protein